MKIVRDTVGKEIGKYADLSKMSDPVARDEARDSLPSIKQMLTWYNQNEVQDNEAYKNRMATRIEYARRCFDNDGRITAGAVGETNANDQSRGKYQDSAATLSGNAVGKAYSGSGRITRGVSRHVSGGKSAARKHFLKLYNEAAQERHSDKRGAFFYDRNIGNRIGTRSERQAVLTIDATAENRNLAEQFGT